ncbi:MAG: NADH-quinone oxidoreductase subunit J [Phycisphaerae bacterium]|nr:NADH-quinone oxidoreductase subunit J [Phycisphaerae bacterium]
MLRYRWIIMVTMVAGMAGTALAQEAADATVPISPHIEAVMFYVIGGVAALCALGCVLFSNVVRMAVCLFGTLGTAAGLYFLMAANFLGAIQLIVYAGGTLIVIIFGIMLTSQSPRIRFAPKRIEVIGGVLACVGLFVGLVMVLIRTTWAGGKTGGDYTVAQIGESLLTTYLLPFEVASVLLLAVMIGAAYLCRRDQD